MPALVHDAPFGVLRRRGLLPVNLDPPVLPASAAPFADSLPETTDFPFFTSCADACRWIPAFFALLRASLAEDCLLARLPGGARDDASRESRVSWLMLSIEGLQ